MNIFVLDEDPQIAASLHCDVHVVKMILETTQILCTVRHLSGNPVPEGYKPTHANHPCTKWAMESGGNYLWLWGLLAFLHCEYDRRYAKTHASKRLLAPLNREDGYPLGASGSYARTPFIFCGPESCIRESVVASYRALYLLKAQTMKRPMRWTKTPVPAWMAESDNQETEGA